VLAGCGGGEVADRSSGPASSQVNAQAPSALERAALETGAIPDIADLSPVGLYRHHHESGADQLCIVPGDEPGQMRFGMQVIFGKETRCDGRGTVRMAGDRLIFNFARSACLVVAGYDGDRVVLPGALDRQCASQCNGGGALDGAAFPRVATDPAIATDAEGRDGQSLCPPA
jgi:hypothetical protein